jgi:hypothetical protein
MNKLQVTAEQAKALKGFLSFYKDKSLEIFSSSRSMFHDEYKSIKYLSLDQMAIAQFIGYEIPQPTPQEIFWAELNRPDNFFKIGDALVTVNGHVYIIVEDSENLQLRTCYMNDAINMLDSDSIKAIYPVDSRKDFPHATS